MDSTSTEAFLRFLLVRDGLYGFLRLALREGTSTEPYRGPTDHGEKVYELRYAGGFLGMALGIQVVRVRHPIR
jgi:hypothetical protein